MRPTSLPIVDPLFSAHERRCVLPLRSQGLVLLNCSFGPAIDGAGLLKHLKHRATSPSSLAASRKRAASSQPFHFALEPGPQSLAGRCPHDKELRLAPP